MKACPICHARAFDDAEMCYGCLHRFTGEAAAPPPRAVAHGVASVEEGLARARSALAQQRASDAPQPAPCPFGGEVQVPAALRAAPARRGEPAGSARALEAPPFDGGGWIVRFEFPGFGPAEGPAGAAAQPARSQAAGAEGLVVSLRPSAAPEAGFGSAGAARGIHARAEERPLPEAAATEGS